jgi:hypothetical protein
VADALLKGGRRCNDGGGSFSPRLKLELRDGGLDVRRVSTLPKLPVLVTPLMLVLGGTKGVLAIKESLESNSLSVTNFIDQNDGKADDITSTGGLNMYDIY